MGVRMDFNLNVLNQTLQQFEENVQKQVVRIFSFVGEKCINEYKNAGNYQDRTSNLRNSGGFIVVSKGKIHNSLFGHGEGAKKAAELARQLSTKHPQGDALIVVSGMNYASYVESKGYNVLTTAEMLAERELPNLLRQLSQ